MPNGYKSNRGLLHGLPHFHEVTIVGNFLCNFPEIYYFFTNIYVKEYIHISENKTQMDLQCTQFSPA